MSWSRYYRSRAEFYADAVTANTTSAGTDDSSSTTPSVTASSGSSDSSSSSTSASNAAGDAQRAATVADVEGAQLQAARNAAALIIESGAVGDGDVYVSLSGHANENHAAAEGQALEVVTVTVQQVAPATSPR